jgi:hypothetical protein
MAARASARPGTSRPKPTEIDLTVTNLEEQVRKRAYELYLERGGQGGSDRDDWLKAEAEILGQGSEQTRVSMKA